MVKAWYEFCLIWGQGLPAEVSRRSESPRPKEEGHIYQTRRTENKFAPSCFNHNFAFIINKLFHVFKYLQQTKMKEPKHDFRIELATENDIDEIVSIRVPAFSDLPLDTIIYGPDSVTMRAEVAKRHLQAWQQHAKAYPNVGMNAIKCVYTNPATGQQQIVGYAEWYIFDRERNEDEYSVSGLLTNASFLPEHIQSEAAKWFDPMNRTRVKLVGGKPHALLVWMCVAPEFRRQGISTMCVRWGMNVCDKLRIPGILEASEEGFHVYSKLGWQKIGDLECDGNVYPVMQYTPK